MSRLKRNGEVVLVPFEDIIVDEEKNNKRIIYRNIEELAQSILKSGMKLPVDVKKVKGEEKYELLHGHRRMRALKLLAEQGHPIAAIRAFLLPQNYKQEDVLLDMIIKNDGDPLNNYEQGLVCVQLRNCGFQDNQISEKTGKSITHIRNCIEITELPMKIQNQVASGQVSGLTAVNIVKTSDSEDEAFEKIADSIRKAEAEKGEGARATNRHAGINLSPYKRLEKVKEILKEKGISNEKTELLNKLLSRAKAKEDPETFIELFS